jgi:hypothetical protein
MIGKKGLLTIILLLSAFSQGIGFDSHTDHDPVPCGPIPTFEHGASYLRDVYVSVSGSDANDGSASSPYRTLGKAASAARPGDIIHLMQGTYSGGISISSLSGTRSNPIQILGHGAVIQGGGNCLQLSRCSYLVLRNISCTGSTYNGLNVDDGSDYNNHLASSNIIFDSLHIFSIGTGGNNDNLKLSGIRDFYVLNNHYHDSGAGSGIDMVGCHNGIIAYNRMENMGSNFIQTKGGSSNITIHGNILKNAVDRGLNMGGSTGAEYFRPPISSMTEAYEARHIRATSNIIIGSMAGIAYVGCDECLATNNVIYLPTRWGLRILQETTSLGGRAFVPSRRGEFVNNIVVIDNRVSTVVNIGAGTEPNSFRFSHNLWSHADNPSYQGPSLPTTEIGRIIGQPGFISPPLDFHISASSIARSGAESGWVRADADSICFTGQIGAYSTGTCTPNWVCTDWSACTNSQQSRTCTDASNCGTPSGKPAESQACTCVHAADNDPCDGGISTSEIMAYLSAWRNGSLVSLSELMEAVRLWKA